MHTIMLAVAFLSLIFGLFIIFLVTLHLVSIARNFRRASSVPQPEQNIVVEPVIEEKFYVDNFGNTIHPGEKVIVITNEPDNDDNCVMTYFGVTTKHNIPVVIDSDGKELFCLGGGVYRHTDELESYLAPLKSIERYNYMAYLLGAGDSQIREKYAVRYKIWS